jgi:DedD protein
MPSLRHSDHDLNDYQDDREQDREISLGMGTILAIFFGLALVCALFFGFGYSMGRKAGQPTVAASPDSAPATATGGSKPSPGSPLKAVESLFGKKQPAPAAPTPDADAPVDPNARPSSDPALAAQIKQELQDAPSGNTAKPQAAARAAASGGASGSVLTQDLGGDKSPRAAHSAPVAAPPGVMPAVSPNGTAMVQVAAVSHQEDADLLLSALKRRGYTVFIRQEPQDHLLHVQVGPFASKKDAEVMRQKLLTDGYNAIVK